MFTLIKRAFRRFRSAITGRFVSAEYAKDHKDTTVGEVVNKK